MRQSTNTGPPYYGMMTGWRMGDLHGAELEERLAWKINSKVKWRLGVKRKMGQNEDVFKPACPIVRILLLRAA